MVTQSSDSAAPTTATGNNLTGSAVTGNVDVESTQTLSGNISADTQASAGSYAGVSATLTTAATGNTGASVISGGGALTGHYRQTTTSATVDGESQFDAPNAESTDVSQSVQAIANDQSFGTTGSTINASVTQANSAKVTADGGAVIGDVSDQGSFVAVGSGNNVNGDSAGANTQTLTVGQTNDASVTQGAMFVNLGDSEVTNTSATATGNNASASNTSGPLTVGVNQDNESYIRAQSVETSYEFGGASVSAYGVGNSALAANQGPSVNLNNVQVNGIGGVESIASFTGNNGYDAFVSSTATGNAVTAFACSTCGGVMNIQNNQTNYGDASASASLSLTSGARSARAAATAVGNTATFYVSSPSN